MRKGGKFTDDLSLTWLYMLEPPWYGPDYDRSDHWVIWVVGWAWAVSGVVLGALVAPSILRWAGVSSTQYQDWLVIVVALLAGILVQLLGWCMYIVVIKGAVYLFDGFFRDVIGLLFLVVCILPFAGVGYCIYRYLIWVGTGQRSITVAFAVTFLAKTLLIPFIKGLVTGALFKWFMNRLRGGNPKSA